MRARRQFRIGGWLLLLVVAGCGSSSTTVTSPAPAERCGITLNTGSASVPAVGGSGAIGVSATRECTWTATADGTWLSIRSGATGQGEGTVEFAATPNPDPQVRTGAVVVNGSRAQITQAAGECVITLPSASANFPPAGGAAQIEVRASSPLCGWAATSDAPWITITSGSNGRGNGSVGVAVAATAGPPRTGSLDIAGQQFSVTQSEGCSYSIDRTENSVSSAGGSGKVLVTTAPACPWTAASNATWISVNPSTGAGPGAVDFTIAPTNGPQRTGTAVIAGRVFTVTQSPGCAYAVRPLSHTVAASGGTGTVAVETNPGCGWSAASNAAWLTIQGAATGSGSGQLVFSAGATNGPTRTGTLTVAGEQVTVTQSQGCTYAIAPESQSFSPAGGNGKVSVTAGAGCAWIASSSAAWVTITSGASGSGNGDVQFNVAATNGPGRSTTLTIAGKTFTVTQGAGCSFSLSADSHDVPAGGASGSVDVIAAAGCGWAAESTSRPWLTITSGANGSGNGTVTFAAAPNDGPARQGALTIAGRTFTVNQSGGCSYSIDPAQATVDASGGQLDVNVSTSGGCAWQARSNVAWIQVTEGASGTDNARVRLAIDPNTGADRTGTVTIAGQTFTLTQGSGCSFAVSPETIAGVDAAGATTRVEVTTSASCGWTATSNAEWVSIAPPASGSGNGAVDLTIAANTHSDSRTATVTVANRDIPVTQQGAAPPPSCVVTLTPESMTMALSGGTGSVAVGATEGCTWSAAASESWIKITAGASGTGNGTVEFTVDPATAPRAGSITVNGRTFTITQQ